MSSIGMYTHTHSYTPIYTRKKKKEFTVNTRACVC